MIYETRIILTETTARVNYSVRKKQKRKKKRKKKKYHVPIVRSIRTPLTITEIKIVIVVNLSPTYPRPRNFLFYVDPPTRNRNIDFPTYGTIKKKEKEDYFSFTCREYSRRILTLA